MKEETIQIEKRVKRYWYSDGIGELLGGAAFLVLALYFSAQQYFGDQSLIGNLLQVTFVVFLIGSIFLMRKLINFLKTRVTYPRTGYVEYRQTGRNIVWMRVLSVLVAMVVAMASVIIVRRIDFIDSMVAITGALVAVILLVKQGWSVGVGRFYFFSALSLVLGSALSVSGLAPGYNLGFFYGLMGITFVVSGGIILRRYLSENPVPAETNNE